MTSAIPVERSNQLSYQANWELVNCEFVNYIPVDEEGVIRIHESHIFVLRKIHFKQMKIIAVYTQLKQLRNKA